MRPCTAVPWLRLLVAMHTAWASHSHAHCMGIASSVQLVQWSPRQVFVVAAASDLSDVTVALQPIASIDQAPCVQGGQGAPRELRSQGGGSSVLGSIVSVVVWAGSCTPSLPAPRPARDHRPRYPRTGPHAAVLAPTLHPQARYRSHLPRPPLWHSGTDDGATPDESGCGDMLLQ